MSSGGMTCLLDRLQRRGFVARRDCPVDRRAVWVALTAEGTRFMDAAFPAHAARIRTALAGIAPPERRPLLDALRRLGRYAADAARALGGAPSEAGAGAARTSRRGRRPAAAPAGRT
jgi:MarR family 2-MHQ and catechol resistance regulon transcriptional repressor